MKKRPEKGSSSKSTPLAKIRTQTGLSESEFGHTVGLPVDTVHSLSLGRRQLTDKQWALIELGVGAEHGENDSPRCSSTQTAYSKTFYQKWQQFGREFSQDKHQKDSLSRIFNDLACITTAAQKKGCLPVVAHLIEEHFRQTVSLFDLVKAVQATMVDQGLASNLLDKNAILTQTRLAARDYFKSTKKR